MGTSFASLRATMIRVSRSRLASDTLIYLLSTAFNMVLPFLLLPVFTRLLTPEQFGPVVIVQGSLSFFSVVLALGLRVLILRSFVADDAVEAHATFGSAMALSLILTLLCAVVSAVFAAVELQPLALPPEWLLYIAIAAGSSVPTQYFLAVLQARRQAVAFGFLQNLTTILSAGLSIAFIFCFSGDWTSRAAGVLIGPTLAGILTALLAWRQGVIGKPTRTVFSEGAAFAWATLPHSAVNSFLGFADRLFVAHYATPAVLAYYGVASQLCLVPFAIGVAVNTALQPWWMSRFKNLTVLSEWYELRRIGVVISAALCALSFFYMIVAYAIIDFALPQEYGKAWKFFPILFVGSVMNIIYFQFVNAIFYFKRTRILSRIGYINLVFTLFSMAFFAELLGAIGIAIALSVSRGFLLVCVYLASDRIVHEELVIR